MISPKQKIKESIDLKSFNKDEVNNNGENIIKFIKRTLENNTHEVIEDSKLKKITSWRKSKEKFSQNLIYNILSFGLLHIISLYYPNLYLKLYCNPWPPKECDFFLVENIYGELTLCAKIHKKRKNNDINFDSNALNENISSSSISLSNNKIDYNLTKNLTYSFKYKSVTYEYNEEANEIIPVYMNISKIANKNIINYFNDGLSSDEQIRKFKERYGKNEYNLNFDIYNFYSKKMEIFYFIIIILTKAFELFTSDYFSLVITFGAIILILIIEYFVSRNIIFSIYEKEYTLDGNKNKLKVKRKHKLDKNSNFYYEINNEDLLPGDIIYLKSNDLVPCDCLILEGDCIVNENYLTGSLDIFKKISLENNNEQFSYKLNKINILYHGMKIIKTYSKLNEGYISALCINTGSNTFKANQYSNILYIFERKKEYKEMYNLMGEGRKYTLVLMVVIFFFSILLGVFYMFNVEKVDDYSRLKELLLKSLAKILSKSFMPIYFLTNSIILIFSTLSLKKDNIICFDRSKFLSSSTINTIFFGKTGILCDNKLEINAYHPISINPHKPSNISYKTFKSSQFKEMNSQLLKYYKYYLSKCQNINNNLDSNLRQDFKFENNPKNIEKIKIESFECTTLFLECLLSCNNLEKSNIDLFGNLIEKEIFLNMKWDTKPYIFSNYKKNEKNLNEEKEYFDQINDINHKYYYDNKYNLIDKRINDIYPNNYYKITESIKNERRNNKPILTRFNSKYYLEQFTKNNKPNINNIQNLIKYNASKTHVKSYKLRIYKKFINHGTLNSSAIVYNFVTKELRFMTKGMPEEILSKCDYTTLPNNFNKIMSFYRRKGFIIIICASKIINIDEYKESNSIEDYMNDLTFCGFVTLKSKLKKEVINSIKELKQFNCKLIISTGDNLYNTLSVGFDSQIIENKNIFSFDMNDKKNGIEITKLYSIKKINEEETDLKSNTTSFEKYSKRTSKISSNLVVNSQQLRRNDSMLSKTSNGIFINHNQIPKKSNVINLNSYSNQLSNDSDRNKLLIENSKINNKKNNLMRMIKNNYKNSKNVMSYANIEKEVSKNNWQSYLNSKKIKKKSNINNLSPLNLSNKNNQNNNDDKKKKISSENIDYQISSINKKSNNTIHSIKTLNLEKFDYYPGIFRENEDLSDNCIYCISGRAFNFLYKNKEKKQYKKILENIHKYCKIFFNMSSIDKSLAIDFYREFPDSCICQIGKCQSDFDAIITSNIGINFSSPKNINTILCHFYSEESNILSIKKIIRRGRAVKENIILLKISSIFYTMTLNSYIICCFIRQVDIVNNQLNLLEFFFFIMSISAFTIKEDYFAKSNPLIQNKKLYISHYFFQIFGIFLIKFICIYGQCRFFIGNEYSIEKAKINIIYCSYYFIFCIEQLISTIFLFNLISFYRKNSFSNPFFILFNLMLFLYFIILETLNSSNFRYDFFNVTIYEFLEEIVDSFADQNKLKSLRICIIDLFFSITYSRIIYFIFDKLAQRKNV